MTEEEEEEKEDLEAGEEGNEGEPEEKKLETQEEEEMMVVRPKMKEFQMTTAAGLRIRLEPSFLVSEHGSVVHVRTYVYMGTCAYIYVYMYMYIHV